MLDPFLFLVSKFMVFMPRGDFQKNLQCTQ